MKTETWGLIISVMCSFLSPTDCKVIPGEGTFRINGLFPITRKDGGVNIQSGFMMAKAMEFAVDAVNSEKDFLYGYKLGINSTIDASSAKTVRMSVLNTFMEQVPFLIGPYSSETSYIASILSGTFGQITISYGGTFSDFDNLNHTQESILRTVPSDKFRIQVALDLIKKLRWNYLAVVSSYSYDGEGDSRHFISKLPSIGVCLADQIDLPNNPPPSHYEETINKLDSLDVDKNRRSSKGVVLFTNKDDSRELFRILKRRNLHARFVIICLYACTNYHEIVVGNEDVLEGTLSISIENLEMPGFEEYYLKQLPPTKSSPNYYTRVWEDVHNCTVLNKKKGRKNCTGTERFVRGRGFYPETPVHTVMNAIYALADSISLFLSFICNTQRKWMRSQDDMDKFRSKCVINATDRTMYTEHILFMLKRMAYVDGTLEDFKTPYPRTNRTVRYRISQFTRVNKTYENVLKGVWQTKRDLVSIVPRNELKGYVFTMLDETEEANSTQIVPRIICSNACEPGYVRVSVNNEVKKRCCWTCRECPFNSVSLNNTCKRCKDTEMVKSNKCLRLPEKTASITGPITDKLLLAFVIFVIIGLGLVIFVTVLFIYHNDNRIVRCSGRDLCYMIMIGLVMLFISPITYMVRPSMFACIFRGALPGMSFLMCYAPLFLRASRIYRIFIHAKTSVSRPALISPQSQVFVVFGIVCIQVLLASVWFASKTPAPFYVPSKDNTYMTVQCTGDASAVSMLINLALSVIFMLCCTILAFKTRHFPKNYNEAKFIGVTLYITCVIWAVFLPAYYLTPEHELFLREYLISALCITIGYVTLLGLFGQKVRLLMCPRSSDKDLNNQQMWSFSHSNESHHYDQTNPKTVCD